MTDFKFLFFYNLKTCQFIEADRTSSRKSYKVGVAGLCCKHCGSQKMFPSSPDLIAKNCVTNFLAHFRKCSSIPNEMRHAIFSYRSIHKEQLEKMDKASQKELCRRVWKNIKANVRLSRSNGL